MKQTDKQYLTNMYRTLYLYTDKLNKMVNERYKLSDQVFSDIADRLSSVKESLAIARRNLAPFVVDIK